MHQIQIGDQIIRFDKIRTRTAYELTARGDADRCGCHYCLNFAAQRQSAFPGDFILILEKIGVDPGKEGKVYELGSTAQAPRGATIRPSRADANGFRSKTLPKSANYV